MSTEMIAARVTCRLTKHTLRIYDAEAGNGTIFGRCKNCGEWFRWGTPRDWIVITHEEAAKLPGYDDLALMDGPWRES